MVLPFLQVFFLLIVLKIIVNFYKLSELRRYFQLYKTYTKTSEISFYRYKEQIITLFEEAEIESFGLNIGQDRPIVVDGFENLTLLSSDTVENVVSRFEEAILVFTQRIFESLNPFYWLKMIIWNPIKLIAHLLLFLEIPVLTKTVEK